MKITIRSIIASAVLVISSQSFAEPVELPETNVGRLAQKFLTAANSQDPSAIEQFVSESITETPWNQMTLEKYRTLLSKLREQSGDLRVERIFMADDKNLRTLIASPKAGKKVGLEIVLHEKDSTRACWIWIHHFPDKQLKPLPKESLNEKAQLAAIEQYLNESAEAGVHSGAVLIARHDDVLLDKAWGFANGTTKEPNLARMQYGTASVGKMFTAVAIAQLHEGGKLEYSDTIAKYFPDYPNKEAAGKVQIHHLLTHTAGLGDPFDSPKLSNSKNYKLQSEWFETFADKPLAFAPGDHHEYSNGGYVVLAAIVEKISGKTFAEYVKQNIFNPARMTQTGLTTASEKLPVSVPHAVTIVEDPLGLKGPQPKSSEKKSEDGVGMGGWTSTTHDLYQFARALRTNKLLKETNTCEITTGKVKFLPPPMDVKYCYGFYEMPIGQERMVGHSGGGGDLGMGAEVEMLWNSEHTIIVLSNHGLEEARRTAHDIARFLVYQIEHPTESNLAKDHLSGN